MGKWEIFMLLVESKRLFAQRLVSLALSMFDATNLVGHIIVCLQLCANS